MSSFDSLPRFPVSSILVFIFFKVEWVTFRPYLNQFSLSLLLIWVNLVINVITFTQLERLNFCLIIFCKKYGPIFYCLVILIMNSFLFGLFILGVVSIVSLELF